MQITRTSIASGKTRTLDLPVTEEQFKAWKGGLLVQKAFPHLSDDEREFIMTGITADEWDEMFGDEEE